MYFFPKSKAECFLVLKLNNILWYVDLDDMVILKITLHYTSRQYILLTISTQFLIFFQKQHCNSKSLPMHKQYGF